MCQKLHTEEGERACVCICIWEVVEWYDWWVWSLVDYIILEKWNSCWRAPRAGLFQQLLRPYVIEKFATGLTYVCEWWARWRLTSWNFSLSSSLYMDVMCADVTVDSSYLCFTMLITYLICKGSSHIISFDFPIGLLVKGCGSSLVASGAWTKI